MHISRSDVRRRRADLLAAAALLGLAGCGGDDAGPDPIANRPPAFSSATTATVVENTGGSFYRAAASDPEGNTLSYSIAGGADAARFTITTGGELAFRDPPNFERATDADGDNVYRLDIAVSDGATSVTQPLAVTVTNSKEGVAVTRIATGFVDPVTISAGSAGVILVGERDGSVYRVDTRTGSRELHARVDEGRSITLISVSAVQTFRLSGQFVAMYYDGDNLRVSQYVRDLFSDELVPDPTDVLSVPVFGYEGGWVAHDAQANLLIATGDAFQRVNPTLSAQDDATRVGKLFRVTLETDPFLPRPTYRFEQIAKGFLHPTGGGFLGSNVLLPDEGAELNLIPLSATGQNFGWPYRTGTNVLLDGGPGGLIDPVLDYRPATPPATPSQPDDAFRPAIVGGAAGPEAIASLANRYVLATVRGEILTIDTALLVQGTTRSASDVERRTADFVPDVGTIDRIAAMAAGRDGTLFILDEDGELFRVDPG